MLAARRDTYPERGADRDQWILARRPPRAAVDPLDPMLPQAWLVEDERSASGEVVPVATVFLTNRECPWRCLMCDLWQNTLTDIVPAGALAAQIDQVMALMAAAAGDGGRPPVRTIKLYNSGSFFDPQAVPPAEYEAIAARLQEFERVIVESHPALIGAECWRLQGLLRGRLEVAMGLETVHPEVLPRLNKRMTIEQFAAAAARLAAHGVALRVFVLVQPPFLDEDAALEWAVRSLGFAFDCGAGAATLIPTRGGNGALEALAAAGDFAPPRLSTLETAARRGIELGRGRVFADLWDLERFSRCPRCLPARTDRLREMNLRQVVAPSIGPCADCGEPGG